MLILFGLLSLFLTMIMVAVGSFFLLTKKSARGSATGDQKTQDEIKDVWQYLGLIDDTPNLIRAVVAGDESKGPIIGYITNIPGKKYDPTQTGPRKIVPLTPGEDPRADESEVAKLIREFSGKRVFGLPIIRGIKPLTVDRVVQKDTKGKRDAAEFENQLIANSVKRYGLYHEILRPTYHEDVDTKDGVRFNVYSYAVIEVIDPEPAFTIYPDSLLQTISQIVSGFISTKVIAMTWEEYKEAGKDGKKFEVGELNPLLLKLGVEVTQLTMSDPELNESIQKAMEAKATAEQAAAARIEQGKGEKGYLEQVADGNRYATEQAAIANARRFKELIELFKSNGVSEADATEEANKIIIAEVNAEAIGKLQGTYAPGTGAVVALK